MMLIRKNLLNLHGFAISLSLICSVLSFTPLKAHFTEPTIGADTIPLPFPIYDRRGDGVSNYKRNTYDLKNPSNYKDSIVYDYATKRYIVYEKIGNRYYRTPTTYTFNEFWAMRNRQAEQNYFQERSNTNLRLNRGKVKPKLKVGENLFNRLFGNGKITIVPQGNVDITAGYQGQNIKNPTLPERARKNANFDFDMNTQLNVNADIGGKLKFPINYNSLANFGQDNQLKLDYTGLDDEIVKRFEAGNVTFPSKSTLIPGAQQLFGLKTQMQFGKLFVTTVLANQRSQRQSQQLQGATAVQPFEIKADEYEENRHFLLAQYFKKNYNKVMGNLPAIVAPTQILRMEVWVTNRNGITTDARDVVGLMDLGESQPGVVNPSNPSFPFNSANPLLNQIRSNPTNRNSSLVFNNLVNLGLKPVQDFEKTFARKLDSTQYTFDRQVGYLSLAQPLQTDEVLAVAYQFTFNGKVYQVGEFSQDLPPDSNSANQQVLFLKMLKATSQRPSLPIWSLMMKNVYSLGYGTLSPQDFKLDVLYQEPGLGWKRYVPFGNINQGFPIISLINLDRLNNQRDPQPDGVFDYIENYTVFPQFSRVMFPVLEPFGRDLASGIYTNPATIPSLRDSLFYALYDSIKAIAQQYPNQNRFVLKGSARVSGSSDINIGYNVPRGSVTVSAGGRQLIEGVDYDINYDLGTIKITNAAIINAGTPVQVNSENNATFGLLQRGYMGLRFDYLAKDKLKEQLSIGGTIVRLGERPFFTKVNYNEDPIRNTMYGLDVNYRKEVPRLTKLLDKLPFYKTTAPSNINVFAEGAFLKPGHAPQIGKGNAGVIYIDDFEGTQAGLDLRFPPISWTLASPPQGATDENGNIKYPEAALNDDIAAGRNRAKISWYQIEPVLQQLNVANNPITDRNELSDPRVRQVYQKEIFPQRTTGFGESQMITFDLSYYPTEKGSYNFEDRSSELDATGKLRNPKLRWGGLMRNIDQPDFETANIEFIEFWMQDPFILKPSSTGGKLYFNLGNISEDVLKDGKRFYENGLPTPTAPAPTDESNWAKVPRNPIQVTNAFSNDPADRGFQDIGFDGLNDTAEARKRSTYLNNLQTLFGANSPQFLAAKNDPSNDNYVHYRDQTFDQANTGILGRYKKFNNNEGNSPIANTTSQFTNAATLYPDAEDLNRDNTLNQTEEYFQYIVDIKPPSSSVMQIGTNYIVDKKPVVVNLPNSTSRTETWYQFRIPISEFKQKIGNIPDFKSIRFIRMFMTDFEDSVTLRFAELQLTRNVWRRFQYKIDTTGQTVLLNSTNANFNVGAVNIEENDKKTPLPYRTPKDIQRQQTQSNNGVNLLLNEQSMNLQICNLQKGDARGVIQTFGNRDLRQYRKLAMYIHAEKKNDLLNLKNKDLTAIVRVGTDFINNYYEVRIPLGLTPFNLATQNPDTDSYNDSLWLPSNSLDLDLDKLIKLKQLRNNTTGNLLQIFRQNQPNGQVYSIMGNPNLGEVRGILIGVENTNASTTDACADVWVNELRLASLDEEGGFAALGRVDLTLADLGTLTLSGNMHTQGFGTLEQRVNDRFRDNFTQFDATATLELGKLLPPKAGISIPVQASYSQQISSPEYDPYDGDVKLKDKLRAASSSTKDSIRNDAIDFTSTTTIAFTNVRKNRTGTKKPKIYDISNFDFSYAYNKVKSHTPLIENNEVIRHNGGMGYNFTPQAKSIEPFKKIFRKTKHKWFDLLKDFNFNPIPSQLTFRAQVLRQFGAIRPRSVGASKYAVPETYDKFFTFQRDYVMRWDLTKSINFDFSATNNSRIDEPFGRIDTKAKKDTIRKNFLKGGRNTLYSQSANFTYALPTSKLPLLDWTTMNVNYRTTYRWIGASRLAVELGNILENSQQQEATAQLDFTRLYQKSKWLRQLDVPSNIEDREKWRKRITKVKDSVTLKSGKKVLKTRRIVDKSAMPYVGGLGKVFGKLITSLKQATLSISENANTRLPGYMDSTQFVGQNFNSMAPGFDFILGRQPDTKWLDRAAQKNLITRDTNFNSLFMQSFNQTITIQAQLEPVRDLNISVNWRKTFNKDYSETFRFTDTTTAGNTAKRFYHLNPYASGGFDVTYISFKTLFEKFDPNQVSATFKKFEDYRIIMSQRLGVKNPYSQIGPQPADGYKFGYGRYATDVLVPAFIAAYTGQSPDKVALIDQSNPNIKSNPFRAIIPKPNWNLTYNGLTRIKGMEKVFTNFSLSHGYTGNLSMNGFTSALLYQDVSALGYPSFYDTLSKNFVPYFLLPNVSIGEQFSPLIGVDMQFTNQLQLKLEYAKSRQLSLSLIDYQLSEVRSTEISIGAGYRKRGMRVPPFLAWFPRLLNKWSKVDDNVPGAPKNQLQNEINFRFDFKMRDNVTANSRLDQNSTFATGGGKEITIQPSIDYTLNQRILVKLFFDQRRLIPYISSSAPQTNTRAGVQVRISLAQ
jgi:cell surface protein SprA